MSYRTNEPVELEDANLSYYCRGCNQQVRGVPLTDPQYRISAYSDDPWLIVKCPTKLCELSFIIYNKLNDRITQVYPLPDFDASNYHKSIPERIREDLAEASRCLHADAYKSCVTMNRRIIQQIVIDNIKDKNVRTKKLWGQIGELFNAGFITKNLMETAHEIRHFGNFGAHPSNDKLDNTTREDAKLVDSLTWDLIREIYIIPYRTSQLREQRKSK